ncbi:MAG: bifunctional methionine sulfoxide reductase B/A protein [Thermoguttaceae bacterium]
MTTRQHNYNPLSAEEESILVHQATERPNTGTLLANKSSGTYICKQCDAPLYDSTAKFESHCGWPSFDDEIAGAVIRRSDADGLRTEIICAACGGHLGHVFLGEHYTAKETRHCVNSLSMKFVPDVKLRTAYFAAGCFWGPEYFFRRAKGVVQTPPKESASAKPLYAPTTVGYMGGTIPTPTYKDVCTGLTGHAETLRVIYDENKTSYEDLVKLFFETHDSTQVNRQGPDIGTQYRSAIFYVDDDQRKVAEKIIKQLKARGVAVATKLEKSTTFWFAEDYHQVYYDKKGSEPTCHVYKPIFE